jgi:hypothetical protein
MRANVSEAEESLAQGGVAGLHRQGRRHGGCGCADANGLQRGATRTAMDFHAGESMPATSHADPNDDRANHPKTEKPRDSGALDWLGD